MRPRIKLNVSQLHLLWCSRFDSLASAEETIGSMGERLRILTFSLHWAPFFIFPARRSSSGGTGSAWGRSPFTSYLGIPAGGGVCSG
ncbi:hypothetical protein GE09DRAFT_411294 [Coniochaeta sp. 2T2.1]|nr:hypothetical protein GE09DRAFT_411294 [Coniochaeta sp. 2T2.1]